MTDQTPSPHVDEHSLECVRDFLHREFRGGRHEDYFDPVKAVQVFRIEGTRGLHHTLIIPRATFEHADFGILCNAHLLDVLRGGRRPRHADRGRGGHRPRRAHTILRARSARSVQASSPTARRRHRGRHGAWHCKSSGALRALHRSLTKAPAHGRRARRRRAGGRSSAIPARGGQAGQRADPGEMRAGLAVGVREAAGVAPGSDRLAETLKIAHSPRMAGRRLLLHSIPGGDAMNAKKTEGDQRPWT